MDEFLKVEKWILKSLLAGACSAVIGLLWSINGEVRDTRETMAAFMARMDSKVADHDRRLDKQMEIVHRDEIALQDDEARLRVLEVLRNKRL